MAYSSNTGSQIAIGTPASVPVDKSLCKINISGYSLDNYKTFNPDGYTVLCNLGEVSDGFKYFPKSSKIVLDTGQYSKLVNNFDQVIPNIASDFGITEQAALEKSVDFFADKKVYVQPKGIQGKIYNIINSVQNYVPMAYTTKALSILKTTGATGLNIITKAPLTFVGATYVGSVFFGYFGCIAGDNVAGLILNSTSYILSRPMRGVEVTLNGVLLRPISNVIGVPLILNGTQEVLNGKGLSSEDYAKIGFAFERIVNSTVVKKGKKILKILREEDE